MVHLLHAELEDLVGFGIADSKVMKNTCERDDVPVSGEIMFAVVTAGVDLRPHITRLLSGTSTRQYLSWLIEMSVVIVV